MRKQKIFLATFAALYFAFFTFIGIWNFDNFSLFESKDFGVFNQTFWNTVQGRFFLNSTYGSHFASHNSIFLFLLLPFYYLFPHPLTLLVLKNIFLTLAVIPFYLISRNILKDISALPLSLAFMLYPFLSSQNVAAPFEIIYAPFFILFAYYFYSTARFGYFLVFLMFSLLIKEQVMLVAIAFGIYALIQRKSPKWILAPVLLGLAWGVISLAILSYYQRIHHPHPDSIWYLSTLKTRFLSNPRQLLSSLFKGFGSSNLAHSYIALPALKELFLPLGIIPPLLSPVIILALPELILNLLYDRPAMLSPLFHYNMLVACFLFIAAAYGIKKMQSRLAKLLLAELILVCTIISFAFWVRPVLRLSEPANTPTLRQALAYVPKDAFVTVPARFAVQVSSRKKYSLIREGVLGDYVIVERSDPDVLAQVIAQNSYKKIFDRDGVMVFRKEY